MATSAPGEVPVILFEIRWLSGRVEGRCWIRGVSQDDVIGEFQANAGFYGAPRERALVVTAIPCERVTRSLRSVR